MAREIRAKVLLSHVKQPDPWFGLKYSMNLYRGCQHQCIYCDSRSACYRIEEFGEILIKSNAIELLTRELAAKRVRGTIGTGAMNDPYMPLERDVKLTRRALEVIAQHRFPVHVLTKSDLVLRDRDLLSDINRTHATVSFTITTADDDLGRKLEPGAPSVSNRFRAMKTLVAYGIPTGVVMMPVLPFIEDNEENIRAIVQRAHDNGAGYIIPAFGMTLRDRQRTYYYEKLETLFPGMRQRYEQTFGDRYDCPARYADRLAGVFEELCGRVGIATRMKPFDPAKDDQIDLF
ncbi:radical SAM protein [Candidatus Eisenbacteria bacterium]|uniref:Radical SAM protein n=1 Tax=Eiseniibacteriota bacterium TaxID=2212470 RepID=A0ABV6YK75_UNCEI